MLAHSRSTNNSLRRRYSPLVSRARNTAERAPSSTRTPVARSHRLGGPTEDRALYSCSCGYVFDALVSTSVGCPHCGRQQAW